MQYYIKIITISTGTYYLGYGKLTYKKCDYLFLGDNNLFLIFKNKEDYHRKLNELKNTGHKVYENTNIKVKYWITEKVTESGSIFTQMYKGTEFEMYSYLKNLNYELKVESFDTKKAYDNRAKSLRFLGYDINFGVII